MRGLSFFLQMLPFLCILPILSSFPFLANAENFDISASCGPNILSYTHLSRFHASNNLLRVLVPWKAGFGEFIRFNTTSCDLTGFSIEIFQHALQNMRPWAPQIQLFLYGNGTETPSYDGMVEMVNNGEADAIVADLTITKDRMDKVGFTIPYIPTKLVMVTPLIWYKSERNIWEFLKPLSKELWMAFFVSFIVTGYTLYILEYKNPDFHSRKASHVPIHSDLSNAEEATPSNIFKFDLFDKSRIMNAYWFTSLCVIGTQRESVRTHLGRFVTLSWLLSHCELKMISIDGQLPNFGGFGFAFSKNYSSMINNVSKEIVSLAENKTIKHLQSSWTIGGEEYMDQCSPSPLGLRSFAGLFAIFAIVYIVCIVGRLLIKMTLYWLIP